MKAALYLRYTTKAEANQFFLSDIDKLEAYAATHGYELYASYIETCSGKKPVVERPTLSRLLKDITNKRCDVVITTDYSRLSTNVADLLEMLSVIRSCNTTLLTIYSTKEIEDEY